MKRTLLPLTLIAIALAANFRGSAEEPPGPPAPVYVTASTKLLSEHTGKNTLGGTETLKDCRLVLTALGGEDLNALPLDQQNAAIVRGVVLPYGAGVNELVLVDLVAGLPDGTYQGWIAARDQAGNQSAWTAGEAPLAFDQVPPEKPLFLRVKVTDGSALIEVNGEEIKIAATGKVARE